MLIKIKKIISRPWVFLTIVIGLSLFLRFWEIRKIGELVFDEVYFVNFARNYISGVSFFDIHPPLGKLIIALGIKIFGDNSLGWRAMSAIFGTGLILLSYFVGKEIASKRVGFFAAALFALDGMILVYSRLGLIDIFLIFFVMLTFFLITKYVKTQNKYYLLATGVSLGLAACVKYIGWLTLPFLAIILITKKVKFFREEKWYILSLILAVVIYLGFFLFNFRGPDFFSQVVNWHFQSFNYNLGLTEGHPYASKWWSWFLLLRPIWFYFKEVNGKIIGVDAIGNPILWWSSLIIVPLMIWAADKKNKTNLILLSGFLIFLLFWAFFHRVLFFYHALASFTFLIFGLAYWLDKLYQKPNGKIYVAMFFLVTIMLFAYFLPIWTGLPISSKAFYNRIWLKGWI